MHKESGYNSSVSPIQTSQIVETTQKKIEPILQSNKIQTPRALLLKHSIDIDNSNNLIT